MRAGSSERREAADERSKPMQLNRFMIRPHVEQALRDEIGPGDTTGGFLVGEDPVQTAQIYAKGSGIVCGLLLADETIRTVDPDARIEHMVKDGEEMGPGKVLLKIAAKASTFFMIERCALDWIQQMSGIATKTRRYVNLVKHTKVRITDTRKGWPGLRMLQKYAVRCGGAHNHIFSLSNCVLVKDNHIKIAGGIHERTIVPIAETGVDVISVGDLTHSVTSVDISLDVQDIKPSAIRTIERLRAAAG